MSEHSMITRSKKKDIDQQIIPNGNSNNDNHDDDDDDDIFKDVNDIDEYGNIKNLIDYGYDNKILKKKRKIKKKQIKIKIN